MADEQTLNHIMNEYEELRISAANERKKRIEEVNKKIPRVAEIDREIFQCGMENTKRIFKNPDKADEYNMDFKENLRKLENEKSNLLKVNGISDDYNKYKYKCENCSDTGYDKNGKKCKCFKQKLINAAYSVSNIEETIKTQNFDTFLFDYYSKDVGENGVSVYDNMTKIYNNCKRFCDNFDNETKGLVFYGSTGLGKTFLSSAIAKELMDKGKMVIYIRATKLFSINEDYKFGRNTDRSVIDNIYKADLLIIDDLGTEPFNKNNLAFLFDVINERTANNKKIIIDNDVVINDELLKTSTIRRLNNVHFNGYLDRLIDDTYELSGTLSGTMILPDDITLEDYEYNFTSSIDEKIDETRINFQKTIDITEDLWQNILVEIPLKCVNDKNKDLTLEGDGWRLISEDDVKLENNPLSSLKDLL